MITLEMHDLQSDMIMICEKDHDKSCTVFALELIGNEKINQQR